jgi:hypothetical protein
VNYQKSILLPETIYKQWEQNYQGYIGYAMKVTAKSFTRCTPKPYGG